MNYINRDMLRRCMWDISALNKESPVRRVIIWYDERNQEICRNEITPGGRNGLPWGAWYWKVEDIHAD